MVVIEMAKHTFKTVQKHSYGTTDISYRGIIVEREDVYNPSSMGKYKIWGTNVTFPNRGGVKKFIDDVCDHVGKDIIDLREDVLQYFKDTDQTYRYETMIKRLMIK